MCRDLEAYIRQKLEDAKLQKLLHYIPLHEADPIDRQLLVERHLISNEHAQAQYERGVAISQDESTSIMVSEEDHLRIQVLRSGLNFDEAWTEMDGIDGALEAHLPYAFHRQFGYLTCCPTNLGTGMRISVMMHLPACVFAKQMDKVLQSLARLSFAVRGFLGEGTQPTGDLFQVSNQATLGKTEEEIIGEMKSIVPQLIQFERNWRQKLLEDEPAKLKDKVWRAFGILKYAHTISSEEVMELLSDLRLGSHLGILDTIRPDLLNELFIFSQPAHLQRGTKKALEPAERDAMRAALVRHKLGNLGN
jgi:protein arginine kinase